MPKQEELDHITHQNRRFPRLAATAATFLVAVMMGHTAKGDLGDQWILPIHHVDSCGSGCTVFIGEGYDGTDAVEGWGWDPARRVYWALDGLSLTTSNAFPTTTEQYTIEWFQTIGASEWQPIESQFRGVDGEIYPNDPKIPWAGAYGTSHQYIGAEDTAGGAGTWVATGPGPHTPSSTNYAAGPDGIYMWLTRGSWLYAKWDFSWSIRHTWSALRLTQVTATSTRPVIESVSKSGNTITLIWSALAGKTYQVQYKTNLTQTDWINLGGTTPGTYPTATASDVNPPDSRRFYRVELLP